MFLPDEQTTLSDPEVNQSVQENEGKWRRNSSDAAARESYLHAMMARSFKKVNKRLWAEAINDWKLVLEADPTHQRAKNNLLYALITLGYSYADHGLHNEAIELWESAIKMNPDNVDLLHNLAITCEAAGRTNVARRYWDETLRRWETKLKNEPDNAYLRNTVIETHRHLGGHTPSADGHEAPKSIEEYREILKINPNDFEAQYKIATSLYENQKWEEASQSLARLSNQFPKNIEVMNMLGWALINSGHVEQAFQTWNRSLSMDPKNNSTREAIIKARMSMGKVFRNRGMHTQSLVHFKALLRFIPKSSEVYMEIGQTYMYKGDKRSAAQAFQTVLQLDPKNRDARNYLSEMKMRS